MSTNAPRLHSDNPSALPPGTRLGEFELLSLLGVGGFGIVYLAFDHALEREVAVKEYMPASLAGRTETLHVSVRSQSDADTFALGLRSFVNEAKLLARFDHPSLLKVHHFWEANGTAYMAMPVMRGRTVKETRAAMAQPPDEAWLRDMLVPLLGAIEKLHSEGVYHRDIAPDNIQIEPDGHPVLLDFGAARRVISDKSQTLTAILKPAYAPIEQYAEVGSVKQGPWTDLYALGATLHYLLLSHPPPPATARTVHDEDSALSTTACPGCSETFLRTIDWMLAPRPADRPQSVAALREVLDGHARPPLRRVEAHPPATQWDRTVVLDGGGPAAHPAPASHAFAGLLDLELDPDATRVMPRPAPDDATVPRAARPAAAPTPVAPRLPPAPVVVATAAAAAPVATPAPPLMDFSAPPVSAMQAVAPVAAHRARWLPVAAGLGVVAAAALGFALWSRAPAPLDAAALAASAAAASAAATAALPPPTTSPPESSVTTVVVPASPPPRPTADSRAPAGGAAAPTAQPAAARPAPSSRLAPGHLPGTAGTAPQPHATTAPAAETVRPAAEKPPAALPSTPAVTAAPTAEPPKPAAAIGPEARCGARNAIAYFFCMERECLRAEFSGHADCLKWRKEAKRDTN